MTMFAPIYYPYLALIDFCMHMHFLNRVRWRCLGQILNPRVTCFFGTEGVSNCPKPRLTPGLPWRVQPKGDLWTDYLVPVWDLNWTNDWLHWSQLTWHEVCPCASVFNDQQGRRCVSVLPVSRNSCTSAQPLMRMNMGDMVRSCQIDRWPIGP